MKFRARPLRSVLFVPGNKEDWMRKAPRYEADALILDLEDSVPSEGKADAWLLVRRMLEELGASGHTLFVRVNRCRWKVHQRYCPPKRMIRCWPLEEAKRHCNCSSV